MVGAVAVSRFGSIMVNKKTSSCLERPASETFDCDNECGILRTSASCGSEGPCVPRSKLAQHAKASSCPSLSTRSSGSNNKKGPVWRRNSRRSTHPSHQRKTNDLSFFDKLFGKNNKKASSPASSVLDDNSTHSSASTSSTVSSSSSLSSSSSSSPEFKTTPTTQDRAEPTLSCDSDHSALTLDEDDFDCQEREENASDETPSDITLSDDEDIAEHDTDSSSDDDEDEEQEEDEYECFDAQVTKDVEDPLVVKDQPDTTKPRNGSFLMRSKNFFYIVLNAGRRKSTDTADSDVSSITTLSTKATDDSESSSVSSFSEEFDEDDETEEEEEEEEEEEPSFSTMTSTEGPSGIKEVVILPHSARHPDEDELTSSTTSSQEAKCARACQFPVGYRLPPVCLDPIQEDWESLDDATERASSAIAALAFLEMF